jgi:hypothetical protein
MPFCDVKIEGLAGRDGCMRERGGKRGIKGLVEDMMR